MPSIRLSLCTMAIIEAADTMGYHKNPVWIEKQHMANGKVKDPEMHISGMGINAPFENTDPRI